MARMRDYRPLRLIAADADDLQIVSAVLQDAVGKVGEFAYLPGQRRFAFVVNRFLWEVVGDRRMGPFARVRTGCHFDDVVDVKAQNVRLDARDAVVDILAVRFEPSDDGAGCVTLDLAGGGAIKLGVDSVNASLSDVSEPWRVRARPRHDD